MGTFVEAVRRPLRLSVVAVSCAALVSGCQTTDTATYIVPADSCSQYRMPMVQVVQQMEQPISPGVVIASVIIGAALGYLLTGKAEGALIGGAGGAVAGAAGSYLNSRAKTVKSQTELVAAIDTDASTDAQRFSPIGNSLLSLSACRNRQIQDLATGLRSGQITKANGIRMRNEIEAAIKLDGTLIDKVVGEVRGRSEVYNDARLQALKRAGDTNPTVPASSGTQTVVNSANAITQQAESAKTSTQTNLKTLDALLS